MMLRGAAAGGDRAGEGEVAAEAAACVSYCSCAALAQCLPSWWLGSRNRLAVSRSTTCFTPRAMMQWQQEQALKPSFAPHTSASCWLAAVPRVSCLPSSCRASRAPSPRLMPSARLSTGLQDSGTSKTLSRYVCECVFLSCGCEWLPSFLTFLLISSSPLSLFTLASDQGQRGHAGCHVV